MVPAALLLAFGPGLAEAGTAQAPAGVRTGEETLHPGLHLDLDTGLVSNRPTYAEARADLRFSTEAEGRLEWLNGAGRAGEVVADALFEEVRDADAREEASSPVTLEPGSIVRLRTSEDRAAKLRILAVEWTAPEPGRSGFEDGPARRPASVRVEWVLAAEGSSFPAGPTGARAKKAERGIEVSWSDGSRCRVERVDEDTGARAVLAPDAPSPFVDQTAAEGGFYRYEVSRRLGGEAHSDRARAYAVNSEAGLRGTLEVQGSAPRIDLARGLVDGPRHDLTVFGIAPAGVNFAPPAGGAILAVPTEGGMPSGGWTTEGATLVPAGGSLLVRTRDGRFARVRVLEIPTGEAKGQGARLAFEFLADYSRAFVDAPAGLAAAVERGRVRLRWAARDGERFRVERLVRGEFEEVGETERGEFEEPVGERLFAAYRIVRLDRRGSESLPSEVASMGLFAEGEGEAFASRAVAALGDADHARREEAQRALEAMGEAALPALRRGAESRDPEVAERAGDALRRLGAPADAPSTKAAAGALAEDLGLEGAAERGLLDPDRRLLALLSGRISPEERASLAERDPDPLVKLLAKGEGLPGPGPVEEAWYAEETPEPYVFDRAAAERLFGSDRAGPEIAAEIARGLTRRPMRDAWLLRTVVEALRDPALLVDRRDRIEVALRCLHGRAPGDPSAVSAAESVLGDGFALERARALRAVARGATGPPAEPVATVEVETFGALQAAVDAASPGIRIVLRAAEFRADASATLLVRKSGLVLAAGGEGAVLRFFVRVEDAADLRLEGLTLAPERGAALYAIRSSLVAERCVFGPCSIGAVADRSEARFADCRFEAAPASGGGHGIHGQRGSVLVVEDSLIRGFPTGIYLACPALIERTVFAGPPAAQAAIQAAGESYLGLARCAFRRHRAAVRSASAGFACGLVLDGVAQPIEMAGSGFLLCAEDATGAVGSPASPILTGGPEALQPRRPAPRGRRARGPRGRPRRGPRGARLA